MKIGDVDLTKDVLVIAEIGNNHEGDFQLALKLITLAAKTGVQAVKFQTIRPERFVAKSNEARFQQLKKYEFSDAQFKQLSEAARDEGLMFLSTPFDLESVDMLDPLVPAFKIASGDNNFYPLLAKVATKGKPILLSTGLCDLAQVKRSKEFIEEKTRGRTRHATVIPLHCVCAYPTPPQQANLLAVREIADALKCTVGYSDHTLGIDAALAAVSLGARIIEKHFTIDKNHSSFRDHQLSSDPVEMKQLVERIKVTKMLLGDGRKKIEEIESANTISARRSVVAARDLAAGTVLSEDDLGWMRPGGGILPGDEHTLLGRKLKQAVSHGAMITGENLV